MTNLCFLKFLNNRSLLTAIRLVSIGIICSVLFIFWKVSQVITLAAGPGCLFPLIVQCHLCSMFITREHYSFTSCTCFSSNQNRFLLFLFTRCGFNQIKKSILFGEFVTLPYVAKFIKILY